MAQVIDLESAPLIERQHVREEFSVRAAFSMALPAPPEIFRCSSASRPATIRRAIDTISIRSASSSRAISISLPTA